MSRLFPFCRGDLGIQVQFSLTTLQPEQFTCIQRLPHTDPRLAANRANYAAVLYLFDNPNSAAPASTAGRTRTSSRK
jgi:hypothetical protein